MARARKNEVAKIIILIVTSQILGREILSKNIPDPIAFT